MDKQELLDSIHECEKSSPEKMCAMRAEIARLTAELELRADHRDKLAAADVEVRRLTNEAASWRRTLEKMTAERDAAIKRSEYWKAEHLAANAAVDAAIQRAERAERVAVWLPGKNMNFEEGHKRMYWSGGSCPCDGTNAGIYRALVEAGEGGRDGVS